MVRGKGGAGWLTCQASWHLAQGWKQGLRRTWTERAPFDSAWAHPGGHTCAWIVALLLHSRCYVIIAPACIRRCAASASAAPAAPPAVPACLPSSFSATCAAQGEHQEQSAAQPLHLPQPQTDASSHLPTRCVLSLRQQRLHAHPIHCLPIGNTACRGAGSEEASSYTSIRRIFSLTLSLTLILLLRASNLLLSFARIAPHHRACVLQPRSITPGGVGTFFKSADTGWKYMRYNTSPCTKLVETLKGEAQSSICIRWVEGFELFLYSPPSRSNFQL